MSLLELYVNYFIVKLILLIIWLTLILAKVKGLENVRLVKIGVIELRLVDFVILLAFDHFFDLHNTFALLESLGPFTLWLASRRYHE